MPRKILGACLLAGSCLAITAAAMVKVTTDPVSVPVAYSRVPGVVPDKSGQAFGTDDQQVVGLRSDRLALPPDNPPATAPEPVNAPGPDPAAQTQLLNAQALHAQALNAQALNAQAMASPAEVEQETTAPPRHHIETRHAARHRVRSHAVTQPAETAKTAAPEKDKATELACANGNSFLRAVNLAPACH